MLQTQRVHLDISVGEEAIDYQQVQSREKLSDLQVQIRQLLDQVETITKEQNYQRVSCFQYLTILLTIPVTRVTVLCTVKIYVCAEDFVPFFISLSLSYNKVSGKYARL